jgi:hypothetical protein
MSALFRTRRLLNVVHPRLASHQHTAPPCVAATTLTFVASVI